LDQVALSIALATDDLPWAAVGESLNFPLYARACVARDTTLVHYRDPLNLVKDSLCLQQLAGLCQAQPALWRLLGTSDAWNFVVQALEEQFGTSLPVGVRKKAVASSTTADVAHPSLSEISQSLGSAQRRAAQSSNPLGRLVSFMLPSRRRKDFSSEYEEGARSPVCTRILRDGFITTKLPTWHPTTIDSASQEQSGGGKADDMVKPVKVPRSLWSKPVREFEVQALSRQQSSKVDKTNMVRPTLWSKPPPMYEIQNQSRQQSSKVDKDNTVRPTLWSEPPPMYEIQNQSRQQSSKVDKTNTVRPTLWSEPPPMYEIQNQSRQQSSKVDKDNTVRPTLWSEPPPMYEIQNSSRRQSIGIRPLLDDVPPHTAARAREALPSWFVEQGTGEEWAGEFAQQGTSIASYVMPASIVLLALYLLSSKSAKDVIPLVTPVLAPRP
jgi:hypothetical protein